MIITIPYYIDVMLEVNNEVYPGITPILKTASYIILSNDENITIENMDSKAQSANYVTNCDENSYYEVSLYASLKVNTDCITNNDYIREHIDVGFCLDNVELSDYLIMNITEDISNNGITLKQAIEEFSQAQ